MAGKGSKPGERRGGRQKGTPNKVTADLRDAISAAFDQAGGVEYLVGLSVKNPQAFCTLLGKVIPAKVEHSGSILHELARLTPAERAARAAELVAKARQLPAEHDQ